MTAVARLDRNTGCSPIMTLRLLAMADEASRPAVVHEPEQLMLPFDWPRPQLVLHEEPPPPPRVRPDPRQWGGRVTLAAFEIMLGKRPAQQLARIVDAKTLHKLAMHTARYGRERARLRPNQVPGRPRLSTVRCYQPHPDAAEITAVVHDGLRFRAVAIRLSARGEQWVATAFEMG